MLVGREDEQQTVDALLAGARLGDSRVLVVRGPPGIGKSALLRYVVDAAHGFRLLRVVGAESERELPFAGLGQLLGPLTGGLDALPEPQARALGVALALREGDPVDRFAVSVAALTLLTRACEIRPVGIVVDDAHLLDQPSAEVLTFVARRLLADAVFLVAAVRPDEPEVWARSGLPRLDLGGLAPGSSGALAEASAPVPLTGAQAARIADLGAGNPLAIQALARHPEVLTGQTGLAGVVPEIAVGAFGRAVAELEPEVRHALQVAAVADGDLSLTSRVCAREGLVLSALEPSERAGLVVVGVDRVDFTHPLARAVVYTDLSPVDRRRLHGRVAEELPPGDRDRRAWHLSAAALGPDEAVATELEGVGLRAAGRGAFAVAASAHDRAARLTVGDQGRARRFLAAGEAAWYAGDDARATALLDEAVRHQPSPTARARARAITGMAAARGGSLSHARDLLLAAAGEAEVDAADQALLLYAEAIEACVFLLDATGAAAAADAAESLLSDQPLGRPRAVAWVAIGMARILGGGPGVEPLRQGVAELAALAEVAPQEYSSWEVLGPLFLRETSGGRELIEQALDRRRQDSALGTLPHLLFHLARDHATTDRWSRAEAGYGEAVALAEECGQVNEQGASLAGLAWLLGREGRVEECRAVAAQAEQIVSSRQLHLLSAWVRFALAELDLSLGEVTNAIEGFTALEEMLAQHGVLDPDLSPAPELVEALVRAGRPGPAREVATPYLRLAEDKGQPWSLARAARVRAMLGPDGAADEGFAEALSWHAVTLDRFETARTRLVYGERLRRCRRRVEAREQLRPALEEFERLGARRWSEVALTELQATGQTAQRRESGPVVDLTARELQIGLLLAEGRTTREAASALFLSPKTIEYHLRHVYTKLQIGSRAELAARLGEGSG